MPDKTRFERELDEILENAEGEKKPKGSRKRQFEPFSTNVPKRKSPANSSRIRFNPGSLIILGLLILAVAAFAPAAKVPLAIVGALLVVLGYVSWFRKGGSFSAAGRFPGRSKGGRPAERSGDGEPRVKYWRGRRIEEKPESTVPGDSADRGKIIDFGSPGDDLDPSDRDQDAK